MGETQSSTIGILVGTGNCSGREILMGILRAAAQRPDLKLRIFDIVDDGACRFRQALAEQRLDGIITSELEDPDVAHDLTLSTLPLIVIGTRKTYLMNRKVNLANVRTDDRALGILGARHLLHLGKFASYGYVHIQTCAYRYLSEIRKDGFLSELKRNNTKLHVYLPDSTSEMADAENLCDWLKSLPKPAAILAGSDARAVQVANRCADANIRVPDKVSILGIDNDALCCFATSPTLSSITTDAESQGLMALQKLITRIQRKQPTEKRHVYFASRKYEVISRGSTRILAPGIDLVHRALAYIELNAGERITSDDVVAHLHVSKRLLFLRFREFARKSILASINDAHISRAKRLLAEGHSVTTVVSNAGFGTIVQFRRLFREATGELPSEWQKRNTKSSRSL